MNPGKYIEDFTNGTIWFDDEGNEISFAEMIKQSATKKAAAHRQENLESSMPARDEYGNPPASHNLPER